MLNQTIEDFDFKQVINRVIRMRKRPPYFSFCFGDDFDKSKKRRSHAKNFITVRMKRKFEKKVKVRKTDKEKQKLFSSICVRSE